jgi:hypothetical protein
MVELRINGAQSLDLTKRSVRVEYYNHYLVTSTILGDRRRTVLIIAFLLLIVVASLHHLTQLQRGGIHPRTPLAVSGTILVKTSSSGCRVVLTMIVMTMMRRVHASTFSFGNAILILGQVGPMGRSPSILEYHHGRIHYGRSFRRWCWCLYTHCCRQCVRTTIVRH